MTSASAAIMPISWGPVSKKSIGQGSSKQFPNLRGLNLEGDQVDLPDDFKTKFNILIIAFKREQQEDVNTWIQDLDLYVKQRSDLELYELPILKQFNPLMRFNINNGMRYGIPNQTSREHTITSYLDKASFKSRLLIPSEDEILSLLVNSEGQILWRSTGLSSPEKIESLKTILH